MVSSSLPMKDGTQTTGSERLSFHCQLIYVLNPPATIARLRRAEAACSSGDIEPLLAKSRHLTLSWPILRALRLRASAVMRASFRISELGRFDLTPGSRR